MKEDTKAQIWPLIWVAISAYFVLLSYGIARSTIDSLLQENHGKEAMKYGYAAVAAGVTGVVFLYSRAAGRRPIGTIMVWSAAYSAASLAILLVMIRSDVPYASYGLYVWKDVYIIVLVELIWTLANSAFKQQTATWAYGFFCIAGTLGDMSGSLFGQQFVHSLGSAGLLWFVFPVLFLVAVSGYIAARSCGWPAPKGKAGMKGVLRVVRDSRSIQLMLALVTVIQIATTLIDYSYRNTAFDAYPLVDDRTAAYHQVDMMISIVSMTLQFLSGLLATLLGLRILITTLPIVVGGAAIYYAFHPVFLSVVILKVVNKGLDYSLFRTTKEMLYRPLSYEERTQGKAVVDVFGYRVAKGGASALVIAFSGVAALVAMATVVGILLWLVIALLLIAHVPATNTTAD